MFAVAQVDFNSIRVPAQTDCDHVDRDSSVMQSYRGGDAKTVGDELVYMEPQIVIFVGVSQNACFGKKLLDVRPLNVVETLDGEVVLDLS